MNSPLVALLVDQDALIQNCMAHLKRQQEATQRVAASSGLDSKADEIEYNSIPLAVYWHHLDQFTVNFYGFKNGGGDSSISYTFIPHNGSVHVYTADPPTHSLPYPWMRRAHFTFNTYRTANPQADPALESKAYLALMQHSMVKGYFKRIAMLYQTGAVNRHIDQEGPIVANRTLDPVTFYLIGNVLLVSAAEVLLHDCFFATHQIWFEHETTERARRAAARKFHSEISRTKTPWYSRWRTKPIRPSMVRAQWKKIRDERRISFQDFARKHRGIKSVYPPALGIELPKLVNQISHEAWKSILTATKHRHEVVHPGTPMEMSQKEVNKLNNHLRALQSSLTGELMSRIHTTGDPWI